jgi:hypothetical protein
MNTLPFALQMMKFVTGAFAMSKKKTLRVPFASQLLGKIECYVGTFHLLSFSRSVAIVNFTSSFVTVPMPYTFYVRPFSSYGLADLLNFGYLWLELHLTSSTA